MNFKKYITELKRRNVFKSGMAYLIVAWLIAQVASIVLPTFDSPPYLMKVLLFILGLGLPITLIIAWIYELTPEGIKKTKNVDHNSSKVSLTNKRLNKLIIATLSIAVILLLFNQLRNTPANIADKINDDIKSIAVLPLINISGDNSLEYFSDGVTQEIIDELAKIKSFTVTAFSTTYQYKSRTKSQIEIANELKIKYLISGSSRVFGDSIKLSIELIDPYSKERIWNGNYNEVLNDAPSIQNSIAKQVANSLNIKLSGSELKSIESLNTIDGEAFKLFLHAKAEIAKLNEEGFINSRKFLIQALTFDPNYTQAHTLLAWNYVMSGGSWIQSNNLSASVTSDLAKPHIEKAIELNPKSSDIYLVRGNYHLNYTGNLDQAKKDVTLALELNSWPKITTNYCICTVVSTYIALGEYDEAKELVTLAKKVDPGNVFNFYDEAVLLMIDGEFQKAQEILLLAENIYDIPFFNFYLGLSLYHDNKYKDAIHHFEKALDTEGILIGFSAAYLSNAHYKLNNHVESSLYKMGVEKRQSFGEHHLNLAMAMISAVQNNNQETLKWLEKSQKESDWGLAFEIMFDPIFKHLIDEPRFIEIRRKMFIND